MTEEFTLTLNSPITEEQWDVITDVDFDNTDKVFFRTKHGKEVTFVKQKKGHWVFIKTNPDGSNTYACSECKINKFQMNGSPDQISFCWRCGAKMEVEHE